MRYARVDRTDTGFLLDPNVYLERLSDLANSLPPGARAFATDPLHYDLHGQRCVKNLKPTRLTSGNTGSGNWLEPYLQHNCWRHDEDLIIRYHEVRSVIVNPPRADLDIAHLSEVLLDEVLPYEDGCTHEFACLGGSLVIASADLVAAWIYADCPGRQLSL